MKEKDLKNCKEPTMDEIRRYAKQTGRNFNTDFYSLREELREQAYGGKPPHGYQSWGDYWKSY